MIKENFITIKELAVKLNIPVSWIYDRTRLGPKAIPHIRAGKHIRFDLEEVVKFLKKEGLAKDEERPC